MDRPPPSLSAQTTSPWAPTTWRLSSITAVAKTSSSLSAMLLQSSPSQVTYQTTSDMTLKKMLPQCLYSFNNLHHNSSTSFAPSSDQVPFTISLAQVNDVNQNDQNFIQNQAIAFTVKLHDPSQYLNNADISFSWDFGDNTGTLISREHTVTHTYLAVGTFKPQVVLMASIPNGCGNPTAGETLNYLLSFLLSYIHIFCKRCQNYVLLICFKLFFQLFLSLPLLLRL